MKRKMIKIVLIVMVAIICIAATYFTLRTYIIMKRIEHYVGYEKVTKIELTDKYSGNSVDFENKEISFKLPIYEEDKEEMFSLDEEDSTFFSASGNGYSLYVRRKKDEAMYENGEIGEEYSNLYNDAKTYNEYKIKLLQTPYQEPSFFQSLEKYKTNLRNNYGKDQYIASYGNEYTTYEKDNYTYAIILDKETTYSNGYNNITIKIYDTDKNYDWISEISIYRNKKNSDRRYMSIEDVSFIVDSLMVSDY